MLIIRILATIGFGISAWLFGMKWTGEITSVVGCGGEGGCANVLGSQWSQWFGIPVSAISAGFYLAIFVLTFRSAKSLLTGAAFLLIAAAVWFMGLQLLVIQSFCPWCLATHLVGLLTAVAILWKSRAPIKPVLLGVPLVLILGLVLGQVFGPKPDTHALTNEEVELTNPGPPSEEGDEDKVKEEARIVEFKTPSGKVAKSFQIGSVPLLGSPDAPHVMLKYFDYTCGSCRDMEGDLSALMAAYPGKVAVILLPTPLNRACNPFLKPGIENHQHACELARLSLAAWRAQPESFTEVHELLFARPVHTPESARKAVEKVIPSDKLSAALADPWAGKMLANNVRDYQTLSSQNIRMPKLIVKGTATMHGVARSPEQFIQSVAKMLELK